MSKRRGSPFLIQPTIVILPEALTSLREFKFMARHEFPREHVVSLEGYVDGDVVSIVEFVDNLDAEGDDGGNWLRYADESVTSAKRSASGRKHTWLGTIHSHPYPTVEERAPANMSVTDHMSGHFHSEIVSGIYVIQTTKNGQRLWSPPISWFVPQGKIKVVTG